MFCVLWKWYTVIFPNNSNTEMSSVVHVSKRFPSVGNIVSNGESGIIWRDTSWECWEQVSSYRDEAVLGTKPDIDNRLCCCLTEWGDSYNFNNVS